MKGDVWKYAKKEDAKALMNILCEVFTSPSISEKMIDSKLSDDVKYGLVYALNFIMAASYQVVESGLEKDEAKSALVGLLADPSLLNEDLGDMEFPLDDKLIAGLIKAF